VVLVKSHGFFSFLILARIADTLIKDDTNADSENMQVAIPSCELFEAT
jgi:hypothetical protein